MKKNIKLRLVGFPFLLLIGFFLWVFAMTENPMTKAFSFVSALCWLLAFIILQFPIYKSEMKGKQ